MNDDEKLTDHEAMLLLRPVLEMLIKNHGVGGANKILARSERELGMNVGRFVEADPEKPS